MTNLTIALQEEIGNSELFVGRKAKLANLLKWTVNARQQLTKSKAILSRRKKGQNSFGPTTLQQSLYPKRFTDRAFLFPSQRAASKPARLCGNGVMYSTHKKLSAYERA